ncbi:hypothetical protein LKI_03920 [Leuconostoc kimchii IMSNU 11154]|uniref:Uncharacterized protein n=1 Tax=Leuconostoc kimchii (strain IMSNU 11154 / KCTC 2386 / IH25) TaxID=762051 RepID=D5T227_LEUKI|nr:hypothetical protein [Leuconostoc kimchii]ADG40326.1 hypothetical protein LKI_03920 [Leuconostoc kimchii IMSNU 11154]
MEDKDLTLDFLNVTVAHLMADIDKMEDYNNAFWQEEILSGQLERAALTASLLRNLLDKFKEVG